MNTSIKHDSQGFLIGELIETSKVALASQQTSMGIWRGIRADVSAIARAMGVASRASSAQQGEARTPRKVSEPAGRAASSAVGLRPYGAQVQVATPRGRDVGGRFLPAPAVKPGAIKDVAEKAVLAVAGHAMPAVPVLGNGAGGEVVVPRGRDVGGRFLPAPAISGGAIKDIAGGASIATAKAVIREPSGRFGSGGKPRGDGGGDGGIGDSLIADKLGKVADIIKGFAQSAENVDPAVTAMGEIKAVVQPIGRLAFTLFGRSPEKKKERWYSKILKALTGKKESTTVVAGGGDEGGLGVALPARLIAGIGSALVAALGVIGAAGLGMYIGTKIYEWLDKSGIATKVFDAFDSIGAWFKEKVAKPLADAKDSANRGFNEVDRTTLNKDQLRRSELTTTFNADGSVMPGDPNPPLAPAKDVSQAAGRGAAHVKNFLAEKASFKPVDSSNDPLSKEYQDRQKNQRTGKGVSGLAGARWNNGAREDLTGAAVVAGVDPGLVAQIGRFESEFDSKATPTRRDGSRISSAHGYGQFIDGTWTDIVNRHGSKYGVEGAGKLTTDQAGALRNDPKLQAAMLAEFTKENVAKGRANGGKDDAANVYAYHNLGDGDAKRMLSAVKSNPAMSARDALIGGRDIGEKERARIESVISNNKSLYGNGSIPASAAYARMGQKMRDGDSYAADARLLASNGGVARSASGIRVPGTVSVAGLQTVVPANIPSSVPQKLPSSPEVTMPPPSPSEKQRPIVVSSNTPVGQNVSDRTIAHTASGGIGSDGRW